MELWFLENKYIFPFVAKFHIRKSQIHVLSQLHEGTDMYFMYSYGSQLITIQLISKVMDRNLENLEIVTLHREEIDG